MEEAFDTSKTTESTQLCINSISDPTFDSKQKGFSFFILITNQTNKRIQIITIIQGNQTSALNQFNKPS